MGHQILLIILQFQIYKLVLRLYRIHFHSKSDNMGPFEQRQQERINATYGRVNPNILKSGANSDIGDQLKKSEDQSSTMTTTTVVVK